jgi:hypothetical protein
MAYSARNLLSCQPDEARTRRHALCSNLNQGNIISTLRQPLGNRELCIDLEDEGCVGRSPEHGMHVRGLSTTDMSLAIEDMCSYGSSIARTDKEGADAL